MEILANIDAVRSMKKENDVVLTIKKRKLIYLEHIMRRDKCQLFQHIMQGKISAKSSTERKHFWLKNQQKWINTTNNQLFKTAVFKIRLALMIVNFRY